MSAISGLGRQLRIARERAGLSREQAAERATLPVQLIESWEVGLDVPSLPRLLGYAEHLGATVDLCVWPRCSNDSGPREPAHAKPRKRKPAAHRVARGPKRV